MVKNNYESLLDAFRELSSVTDEEILTPNAKKLVREGKEFNLNFGSTELEAAKKILAENEVRDEIEVIDVNADTLEHVRDKKAYIGQVIVQCNKCHSNKFIDMQDLVLSPGDEETYNIEDECPNCHTSGDGFELVGQVGKVINQKPVETETSSEQEVRLDNIDQESDVPKFENELEETPEEEQSVDQEDIEIEPEFSEEEIDGTQTTASEEDDDLELPELGDEFDSDNVRPDDTEEDEPEDEEPKDDKVKEELEEPEEEPKPVRRKLRLPTREALETARKARCTLTEELLDTIVLSESIDRVIVTGINGKNKIFEGLVEELPEEIINSSMEGFNVANGYLMCNIDNNQNDANVPLAKILNCFDDNDTVKVIIWDVDTNEQLFHGSKQDALRKFGHCQLVSLDAPKVLCLKVKDISNCSDNECSCEDTNFPEKELCDKIFIENDLAKYNADDPRSEEFWICESVYNKEDLAFVYERYVKNTSNELIEEFKSVTGYKDELDEMCDKYNVKPVKANESLSGKDFDELMALSKKLGLETFGQLQEFSKKHGNIKDLELLKALRDAVKENEIEKDYLKENLSKKSETVTSFKTRKELSEALEKVKDTDTEYKVRRSKKDGYRYDLICEAVQAEFDDDDYEDSYDEYLEEAKKFVKQIENYSLSKCEELYYDDYGFDNNEPADEAEQLIADALVARIKEISTQTPKLANESYEEGFEEEAIDEDFDEDTGDDFKDKIAFLSNDELEAIAGYKEVIEFFKEKGIDEDKIMNRLLELQQDEEEHLEELKELFQAVTGEELVEVESDDLDEQKLKRMFDGDPQYFDEAADIIISWYEREDNIDALKDPDLSDILDLLDASSSPKKREIVAKAIGPEADFIFDDEDEDVELEEAINIKPFFKDVEKLQDEEEFDFDTEMFDADLNEYFTEAYADKVTYNTTNGVIDKKGNIMLEGIIKSSNNEANVRFKLTPNVQLTESLKKQDLVEVIRKTTFKVTNNLSEETFLFTLTDNK